MRLYRATRRYRDKLGPQSRDPSVFTGHIGPNARCAGGPLNMKHVRRGVAGAASHMRHDWRPFQNIWAIYAARRALAAAGLTCHYHRGRRRAATAQCRTQTRRLRNAPSTGLMRDGQLWFGLYIRIGLRASMCLRRRVRASPARPPTKSVSDAGSGTGSVA